MQAHGVGQSVGRSRQSCVGCHRQTQQRCRPRSSGKPSISTPAVSLRVVACFIRKSMEGERTLAVLSAPPVASRIPSGPSRQSSEKTGVGICGAVSIRFHTNRASHGRGAHSCRGQSASESGALQRASQLPPNHNRSRKPVSSLVSFC
jgi:hypothetical protein